MRKIAQDVGNSFPTRPVQSLGSHALVQHLLTCTYLPVLHCHDHSGVHFDLCECIKVRNKSVRADSCLPPPSVLLQRPSPPCDTSATPPQFEAVLGVWVATRGVHHFAATVSGNSFVKIQAVLLCGGTFIRELEAASLAPHSNACLLRNFARLWPHTASWVCVSNIAVQV